MEILSIFSRDYIVVFNLTSLRVTEQPGMHKPKVRHVQQVLDDSWTLSAESVWPRENCSEASIFRGRKFGK